MLAQNHRAKPQITFRRELMDFLRFLWRPSLTPRLPARNALDGLSADWWPGVTLGRLLTWAALLWGLNIIVLGPIAVLSATAGGAKHGMDPFAIPWMMAIFWAPVVEELVFRYGLRRPAQFLWLGPALLPALLWGPQLWTGILLLTVFACANWPLRKGAPARARWPARWRRAYSRHFGWAFHSISLAFAAVHLGNFSLNQTAYWLLPLLVLPQWVTGLVLGWMRVRCGIGASIALHGIFNGGPIAMIWLLRQGLSG